MRTLGLVACCFALLVGGSTGWALESSPLASLEAAGATPTAGIPPDNGRIGIFTDPAGTQHCGAIPLGGIGMLYLFADLAGETAAGITVAEFRIQVTNPAGYLFIYTPPPAAVVSIGNPLDTTPEDPDDASGVDVAYSTCQAGPRVPLGVVQVINMSGGPTDFLVQRRSPPTNSGIPCPLSTQCDIPNYTAVCYGPCGVDATGSAIISRASINDPGCTESYACPSDCPDAPCVDLVVDGPGAACEGEPVTLTLTATNCSAVPEDIDLFADYAPLQSFTGVPPGGSVSAPYTFVHVACGALHPTGAVARHAGCPEPFGTEVMHPVQCDSRLCGGNLPPDCSAAAASLEELWPPNDKLVAVSIVGVVEPNGDSLTVLIQQVTSDEPSGYFGDRTCPDAFRDGSNAWRLRAERDPQGNGRVYTLRYVARDASGLTCRGEAKVCVPKNRHQGCVEDDTVYETRFCDFASPGRDERLDPIRVTNVRGAGAEIGFATEAAGAVRLEVYDIRGRLVRVLDGDFPAGQHAVRWDGRDGAGQPAATGIYLFRMQVGDRVHTAKTVIVR